MSGNGHTDLESLQSLVESAMEAVVSFDGRINLEDVVRTLEEELDQATIQQILMFTSRKNLTDVVMMFT